MVIVFFVQFVMIPLDIAYFSLTYYTFPSNPVWKSVRFTFDCLCIVDVILRFFTGYYHHTKKTVILDYAEVGGFGRNAQYNCR